MHALCGAAMLAFTFALFSFGWIGGGDAKLAAATALWLGWTPLADYGLASALAGGALTVVILMARRLALPEALASQAWIARLHNAKSGIPYGIALAVGGMIVYPETQFWGLLAGPLKSRLSLALRGHARTAVPRRFIFVYVDSSRNRNRLDTAD